MDDDEERRLIVDHSDRAMEYSAITQRLDDGRRFLPKDKYVAVYRKVESARILCEIARLDLEAYRAAKS